MQTKKRLELIIETMAHQRACRVLEQAGVKGYTVIDAIAGFGGGRHWRSMGDLSESKSMVVVIAIADEDKIRAALDDLHRLVDTHIGVLNISTVEVLRPDRF